ncbi:uncharacterized protein LOC134532141 isoform X2 [Bacillus rossius redtenbacheri]|uniref:uncharacterized protein LOC134532141 isoform X2 n=1 Tax=Bacillus rossius redtenbacheri TaxID=93214 RepID=UPI002FDE82D3
MSQNKIAVKSLPSKKLFNSGYRPFHSSIPLICSTLDDQQMNAGECSRLWFLRARLHGTLNYFSCKQWVQQTRRVDLGDEFRARGYECLRNLKVCDVHFGAGDFRNPRNKSQGLKKGVVPSLNIYSERKQLSGKKCHKKRLVVDAANLRRRPLKTSEPRAVPDARRSGGSGTTAASQLREALRRLKLARRTISNLKHTVAALKEERPEARCCSEYAEPSFSTDMCETKDEFLVCQVKLKCRKLRY